MSKSSDVAVRDVSLYFLPVETRIPLKFGPETTYRVNCARVKMRVENKKGVSAEGWGETPLNVQWVWVGALPLSERERELEAFTVELAIAWKDFAVSGHPMEIGSMFQNEMLPRLLAEHNRKRGEREPMPWLAALVACSAFDIALHDAYGKANSRNVYETYDQTFMNKDLSAYISPLEKRKIDFKGLYPADFLVLKRPEAIPAWHLVGGLDLLEEKEKTGKEPEDGYPYLLRDWVARDGLKCLKVKLRGTDAAWDFERLVAVGSIAVETGVHWLSADFNCTVRDPRYVLDILGRLLREQPRYYGMLLYVEQPFPYDLEMNLIDVHAISAMKPLFMDESAHDWKLIRLGTELGWNGVALKTCKTQTGALLSLCWARAHGMSLMVQDLSNPMLAMVPHVLLAAHAGTIMGVETNGCQFYPQASEAEAEIHPALYRIRDGMVGLESIRGDGFGYRIDEIRRTLPVAAVGG